MTDVVLVAVASTMAAALVILAWRVLAGQAEDRARDRIFLLSVLDHVKASSVIEAAQADAIHEAQKREDNMEAAVESLLASEIMDQQQQGYAGEAAQARAFMVKAGLDPDDDASVHLWNSRLNTNLSS